MKLINYLILPSEMTPFEQRYLARLNKIALIFFYLHIPALMAVAAAAGTRPWFALVLSLVVMIGPTIAYRTVQNPRNLSIVYGITAMLMGGLLVHFGQGPVQIEMHFYFFALLAMLCMFANPAVNIAAAVTVALHHLIVWLIVPSSVFNYEAQWWVVLVHAAFVVLETVAACYISREFFDNVIGLEKIVQARTATIKEKQRDMRLILDNVEQGLTTIDLDGCMSSECSHMIEQWFGVPTAGEKLAIWMGQKDKNFGEWLNMGLDSVKDGMLPPEVALGQLPKRMQDKDKTYAVQYQLISSAGAATEVSQERRAEPRAEAISAPAAEKILVIFTDITERLRKEVSERYQADLLNLFQHIMRDKAGFLEFLTESDTIMNALRGATYESVDHKKRLIHTLKGNSAVFGMRSVSEVCHHLENQISEEDRALTELEMAPLYLVWDRVRVDLEKLIGARDRKSIEIDDSDYEAILKAVLGGVDRRLVERMIKSWKLESTRTRLGRIEQQIQGLAQRMGKSPLTVDIESNDLRFHTEHYMPFWSAFIHVLRNAVDHGIEDLEDRAKGGKRQQASIKVSTRTSNDEFIVSIEDDGPGVDWDKLRAKAEALGATSESLKDPNQLICLPGVTTKDSVTELSGRGVGMAAVREACEALGGTFLIHSTRGVGTRLSFVFPCGQTVYEGHAAMLAGSAHALLKAA